MTAESTQHSEVHGMHLGLVRQQQDTHSAHAHDTFPAQSLFQDNNIMPKCV